MVKHFDHLTIVVQDVDRAKAFFALLGFREAISVVIAGEPFASYMGVPGIEADHVTLVLENAAPRTEIQLLRYHHPKAFSDPHIRDLHKVGTRGKPMRRREFLGALGARQQLVRSRRIRNRAGGCGMSASP